MKREEALELLKIENGSGAYFDLLKRAYARNRKSFGNRGYVFAQIGINAEPCPVNCTFCSFGIDHFALPETMKKTYEEVEEQALNLVKEGVQVLFLMATDDYPIEEILFMGKKLRPQLPKEVDLVANIGDFTIKEGRKLIEAGFMGAYHICRLGEGVDTRTSVGTRLETMNAIKKAGGKLFYCLEPIGPEHSYDELITEMERAKEYEIDVMAAMRRVPTKGTPKYSLGTIDMLEFTKIVAVTSLFVEPKLSMNAHETSPMTLLAGVNQLYAEVGSNPRDTKVETKGTRGWDVLSSIKLLEDVGLKV